MNGSILDGSVETFRAAGNTSALEFVDLSDEQKDAVRNDGLDNSNTFTGTTTANPDIITIDGASLSGHVTVPGGAFFLTATYSRIGDDLMLTGEFGDGIHGRISHWAV